MNAARTRRVPAARRGMWLLLLLMCAASIVVGLMLGAVDVSIDDVGQAIMGNDASDGAYVVRTSRLPRVLLAALVGAVLSLSGVLFQALLRNDLAEPYLLGVGPGALLGVTVAAWLASRGLTSFDAEELRTGAAFLGAMAVALVIFSFARRATHSPTVSVLLAGVAVGAFVHALATGFLHSAIHDWQRVVLWLLGDLSLSSFGDVWFLLIVLVVAGGWALTRVKTLDVLTLGDEAAWLGGVSVTRALYVLGGLACVLAAAAVSRCGLIGFVGLVVPHIGRRLVGPGHRALIPAVVLIGSALLVAADTMARTVQAPTELPVGIVTAALGAPVLLLLLLRRWA